MLSMPLRANLIVVVVLIVTCACREIGQNERCVRLAGAFASQSMGNYSCSGADHRPQGTVGVA